MTRRHFERIACALRVQRDRICDRVPVETDEHSYRVAECSDAVAAMATVCAESNPRFNRARSYPAIGLERRRDGSMYPFRVSG